MIELICSYAIVVIRALALAYLIRTWWKLLIAGARNLTIPADFFRMAGIAGAVFATSMGWLGWPS